MLGSCLAVRVNIWNNETNSGYGGDGICRLFTFNIRKLSKKNIQPAFINHKCFTATTANNYFLKFTTLPYAAEITYSIIINKPNQIILAVAPVHHRLSISIVLGFPVTNKCNNQFYLISYKTATEKVSFSTNNSFLFENLQPGFFRVRNLKLYSIQRLSGSACLCLPLLSFLFVLIACGNGNVLIDRTNA